ncbi:class I SAM-dependent methyltransferase [Acrocarpospora macrocephala]|uniref:SAM-dependent methyltransferase n=1 Tax=Acrocarpospora macrocephala TaxID=150177 RepID=A0A5M3X0T8_9ACTN|nr:class I SAM-dependent methyltransferase [Acrocarpospora macrocephala]GES14744.1 SAM-dependent methyltransferase [Acrocarpospora macrocephala]
MDIPPFRADLARSVRLFAAFRKEQSDPEFFYGLLARDTVAQLSAFVPLDGQLVVDVGGGAGYFAEALRGAGARIVCVDVDAGEMTARNGVMPAGSVLGSALRLPLRSGTVDVCFSSNVLEHVPDPYLMAGEMVRVTRPGGLVYLSFTNWLSPWGGHETSPWHYLGGHRAARRYQRRHGRPPKNVYGESMFGVSIASAIRWTRRQTQADVVAVLPRYLPSWAWWVTRVPGVREFVTWNLVLVLRRR